MVYIGIDLGGTKISGAVFGEGNSLLARETRYLDNREGTGVATLISDVCNSLLLPYNITDSQKISLGICVPGIAYSKSGKVWAPNIKGWDMFPLKEFLRSKYPKANIMIESDRTCYILGEVSRGVAKGCENAIFIAVGTGIGAGILIDGRVLHGASDIVGATGWMALEHPYQNKWDSCGCFESEASGNGIAARARELSTIHTSLLNQQSSTKDVFEAYEQNDPVAVMVLEKAIRFWGMAAANFVSLFNPEILVFGGGVFGPATKYIDKIYQEASRWAQPIAIKECRFAATSLPDTAGLYGAGAIAAIGYANSLNQN